MAFWHMEKKPHLETLPNGRKLDCRCVSCRRLLSEHELAALRKAGSAKGVRRSEMVFGRCNSCRTELLGHVGSVSRS